MNPAKNRLTEKENTIKIVSASDSCCCSSPPGSFALSEYRIREHRKNIGEKGYESNKIATFVPICYDFQARESPAEDIKEARKRLRYYSRLRKSAKFYSLGNECGQRALMLDCIYKGTARFPYIRYRRELLLYYLGE